MVPGRETVDGAARAHAHLGGEVSVILDGDRQRSPPGGPTPRDHARQAANRDKRRRNGCDAMPWTGVDAMPWTSALSYDWVSCLDFGGASAYGDGV
jgi:hypothetical protein